MRILEMAKKRGNFILDGFKSVKLAMGIASGIAAAANTVDSAAQSVKDKMPEMKMPDIKNPFAKEKIDEEVAAVMASFEKLDRTKQLKVLVMITKSMNDKIVQ